MTRSRTHKYKKVIIGDDPVQHKVDAVTMARTVIVVKALGDGRDG